MQVVDAAGTLQVARLHQLIGDGDDVGRLAVRVEREDRFEDHLVLRNVEVVAAQALDHVGHGVFRQEHAAQRRLLAQQVVRRRTLTLPASAQALIDDVVDRHRISSRADPSLRERCLAARHVIHRSGNH